LLNCVCSSINDDARSVTSSGERLAGKQSGVESSVLRQLDDNVERISIASTDDGTTTGGDLHGRRCRSSLGRLLKDAHAHTDRQRTQHHVHSLPASLGHVTPPPSSMTSPVATRRRRAADSRLNVEVPRSKRQLPPLPRPEVTPSASERRKNEIDVGTTTRSSVVSDDDNVFVATRDDESASGKQFVDDSTENNAAALAASANVTSFPDSTTQPHDDVTGQLDDKNDVKACTLELDLSAAHSPLSSSTQCPASKPHPVMRKSASCCELRSLAAAVPRVDGENCKSPGSCVTSTSTRRPLLQLQLGQQIGVVCHKTEPTGTSLAVVNVTTETRQSTDVVDKRAGSHDHNDNADRRQRRTTELAQTKTTAWVSSRTNQRRTIAEEDYYGVGGGCMEGEVIQRPSTNNSRHERQMIFV